MVYTFWNLLKLLYFPSLQIFFDESSQIPCVSYMVFFKKLRFHLDVGRVNRVFMRFTRSSCLFYFFFYFLRLQKFTKLFLCALILSKSFYAITLYIYLLDFLPLRSDSSLCVKFQINIVYNNETTRFFHFFEVIVFWCFSEKNILFIYFLVNF